ncbi:MAG: hypothetical protein ABGZ17_12785 [Planctomycetaceae bacterium]
MSIVLGFSGCALLNETSSSDWSFPWLGQQEPGEQPGLSPLRPTRNMVQVEVFITEHPVGDPLLGDILWDNVDESGALAPEIRDNLNDNGFRVGIVGSVPPQALETLLKRARNAASGVFELPRGRRVALLENDTTEIQSSRQFPRCSIETNERNVPTQVRDFEHARCVFRLKAGRHQPGWARLEFQPEIHFGQNRLRHEAGESSWELKTSQQIHKLFGQKFEVTLNQGEMVVISRSRTNPATPGHHFFVGGQDDDRMQRLLVVRLVDMQTAQGVRSK